MPPASWEYKTPQRFVHKKPYDRVSKKIPPNDTFTVLETPAKSELAKKGVFIIHPTDFLEGASPDMIPDSNFLSNVFIMSFRSPPDQTDI